MNEVLMAEDVLRPYGITLYYKGCEYLRDAIILHWHQPNLIPGQLIQLVANQKGAKKSSVLGTISTIANVAWKVNGTGGEKPMSARVNRWRRSLPPCKRSGLRKRCRP